MKKKSNTVFWIISLILSIAVIIGMIIFLYMGSRPDNTGSITESLTHSSTATETSESVTEETTLAKNPFDYKKYHKINSDLFSWIYIPGTDVDHIIARPGKNTGDSF
ncbi:MAG: hypothetical protein ACI4DS_07405, partial [Eubacterium sp.]